MQSSTKLCLGLAALLAAACGTPRDSTPTPPASSAHDGTTTSNESATPIADADELPRDLGLLDAEPVDPQKAASYLVWGFSAEGGGPVTHRLDAEGQELERLAGIFIATSGGIWEWKVTERTVETTPCEKFDEDGSPLPRGTSEPGLAMQGELVQVAGNLAQTLIAPLTSAPAEEYTHAVTLVGSVGPYLFLEDSSYEYSCGAHGNSGMEATIWNAEKGESIQIREDELGDLDPLRAQAATELFDPENEFEDTTHLELTEFVPSYTPDATLELGLQFTATTCYACSDGRWGSYTKSSLVKATSLPSSLARYASPPSAVRAFQAAHPSETISGWSASGPQRN